MQPSVNLHAQLQPLCSAAPVPSVLPRRDEGSGMPCAVIEALVYWPPLRIRTRAAGFKIVSGDHYTTTAHPLHCHCTNGTMMCRGQGEYPGVQVPARIPLYSNYVK